MASPTRWLRKHSKIMMVFVAVFAMAIFGLGSVFDQFVSRSTVGPDTSFNEVVATWNGGKITRGDISNWYRQHFQVQRFLEEVSASGRKLKGDDFRPLARIVPRIQSGERAPQSLVDMELIQKFLFAKKAEKEGVVIGDALVDAYIDLVSGTAGFSRNDLAQINRNVNQRVSLESIYSHLKMELAAQQMRSFSFAGFPEVPNPTEAAELYQKYMEAIELEVVAIPVEQFLGEVSAPSVSDLKALFEQGKHEFSDPSGKRPGFKKPNEVALQYVYADFETTLTNHINRLSDEEVQAEYDRLVAEKSSLVIERIPKQSSPANESGEGGSGGDGPPVLPGDDAAVPTQQSGQADQSGAGEGGAGEGGANNQNREGSQQEESQKTEGAGSGSGDGSQEGSDGSGEVGLDGGQQDANEFQFVSFTQDESKPQEEKKQDSPPQQDPGEKPIPDQNQEKTDQTQQEEQQEKKGDAAEGRSAEGADQQSTESSTAQTENQTTPPGEAGTVQAEQQPPVTGVTPPTAPFDGAMDMDIERLLEQIRSQQGDSMFADDQEFEERVLPLVDVADRVKRNMVFEKVMVEISETMEKATTELGDFQIQLSVWESLENQAAVDKPTLDLKELADRYGLIYDEVPLSDLEGLQKTDLGRVMFSFRDEMGRTRSNSLSELIFFQFDQVKEFNVNMIDDAMTGNTYAYWITEKVPAKVLTFEQAKGQVERFWKNQQALRIAEAQAEEKANSVNAKQQLLSEVFPDQAKSTGEFTWINLFGGSRFGEPFGVESAGEEFMEVAFSLQPKQASVAVNADRSIVYVLQLIGERRSVEQIGTEFIENRMMTMKRVPFEAERVSSFYIQEAYFDWDRAFRDEMGLRLGQ